MRTNLFSRLIAMLLVPCLAGDALIPAGAATFGKWEAALLAEPATPVLSSEQCVPRHALHMTRYDLFAFGSQTLALDATTSRHGLLTRFIAIGALALSLLSHHDKLPAVLNLTSSTRTLYSKHNEKAIRSKAGEILGTV
jgi:hypothetical protein